MTDLRTRDEIDPSSRGRRGAHRAAPSRLAVLLPVAAVAAVVVLTVLALFFFTGLFTGLGGRSAASGGVSAGAPATTPTTPPPTLAPTTPSATTTTPSTPAGTSGASGTPSPGGGSPTSAPGSGSPSPSPNADEQGAADGAAPPPGGQGGAARGAPVVVLNATRTSGLASKTADALKGEGWTVSRTGDASRGVVSATTVRYSDPALESAAQAVAASLGGVAVQRDVGVEKGAVTVITGSDRIGR